MSLLNKQEVRRLVKSVAEARSTKFTQVSEQFITDLDAHVDYIIRESVRRHPSKGKTITQITVRR